jgi:hypothetical protein
MVARGNGVERAINHRNWLASATFESAEQHFEDYNPRIRIFEKAAAIEKALIEHIEAYFPACCCALCQQMQQKLPRELRGLIYEYILSDRVCFVDNETMMILHPEKYTKKEHADRKHEICLWGAGMLEFNKAEHSTLDNTQSLWEPSSLFRHVTNTTYMGRSRFKSFPRRITAWPHWLSIVTRLPT